MSNLFSSITIFYCFSIDAFIPKRLLGLDYSFYACQKEYEHVIILCKFQDYSFCGNSGYTF